ncbi:MAG: transporter related [Solirubrobacterales bacterium]|jgi:branched-chain amino acid transport system ATP-binding protein|nr:transporter related [Solirubrobacterales bacterium]
MSQRLLEIDDLVVRYGPIVAVREVSVNVDRGEIVALLGANGAGKSTILNAVAGLVPAAAGRLVFEGEEIQRLPAEKIVRRGLALVPEGRRVFPKLSVIDNLRLGGVAQRDRSSLDAVRQQVLDLFPVLRERSGQAAGTLSGGQQQMLAIGRALMSSPSLLLLDEPSLGLAPIIVDEIFQLIVGLREQGTTIVLVEQNVHRALEISDRAYVIANGVVDREGPSAQLRASAEIERAYLGIGVSA